MEENGQAAKILELRKQLMAFHDKLHESMLMFGFIAVMSATADPKTSETADSISKMHETYTKIVKSQLDMLDEI